MTLFWRAWATIVLVNLVVLGVFVGLATLRYTGIDTELVGERLTVLADRTAEPFSIAARLGLSLAEVRNAQAVLERARQTDALIEAIHVFDVEGRVVHSTQADALERIDDEAGRAYRQAAGEAWFRDTDSGFLSGVSIEGGELGSVGGILLTYQRRHSQARILAMAAELSVVAMLVWLASGLVGWLPLRLALTWEVALCRRIECTIEAFERRGWRTVAGSRDVHLSPDGRDEELGQLLESSERRYQDACRALEVSGSEASRDGR